MLGLKTIASRLLSRTPTRFLLCSSSFCSSDSLFPSTPTPPNIEFDSKEITLRFKDWFKAKDTSLDPIFNILATKEDDELAELDLDRLGFRLNEEFVLRVLNHGKDVLSCLKFFDWAGRQRGYNHTPVTFNAIFKILSREKLMAVMLDLLENYRMDNRFYHVGFYNTLVVGYAVAGKPHIALQVFGKMRFKGVDLDTFSYHVFLNAMVEQGHFDVADVLFKQMQMRGYENEVTWCIMLKCLCKRNKLKEAVEFLRGLESKGGGVNDGMVGLVVDAHFKRNKTEVARRLMEEFWGSGKFPSGKYYGVWVRELVRAGKLDGALDFLQSRNLLEGYVPDVFCYNILIFRLLRENRLHDVCDLLMEMMEGRISPDKATMNAALCFFCKGGMVDIALKLYISRSEFGLSLNSLSYNYLINTLCGDGSIEESYRVFKDSIKQGYFPRKRAFSIIADALCREGKLDKMKELVFMSLELNTFPSDALCIKLISALCKVGRVEDAYLIYEKINRMNNVTNRYTYFDLVRGFNKMNRGDMAANVLIDMQEHGHSPTRSVYRAVIWCICTMNNSRDQFFKLLEMQLSHQEPNRQIYNLFIDGAGHAKRPDLAWEVFQMMARDGVEPNNDSKIFMLQSYLKNERIADALNYYGDLCKKGTPGRKLNDTMVIGLCKANKPGLALEVLKELREKGVLPSLNCYEELVQSFCSVKNYHMVVEVIDDLLNTRRPLSSFIGNLLLLHSFKGRALYQACAQSGVVTREASPSGSLTLGELVGLFSGSFKVNLPIGDWDEVIEQCFPPDIFTYNMLLRRLSMNHRFDGFIELFHKICKKGHRPNNLTYDTIVHCLCKHGRRDEAMRWLAEMHQMGFELTERTEQQI